MKSLEKKRLKRHELSIVHFCNEAPPPRPLWQQKRRWLWIFCPAAGGVFGRLQFHGGFAYMSTTRFNSKSTSIFNIRSYYLKYHETKSMCHEPCFKGRVQFKPANLFDIWESEYLNTAKFEAAYQMHFISDWLRERESNSVLKWDLLLSWAIIHRQDPILIGSSRKSEKNI